MKHIYTNQTKNFENRQTESHIKPNIQIGSMQHRVGFKCELKWKYLQGIQADWCLRIITTHCELHSSANAYTILELIYTLPSHSSAIIAITTTNSDTKLL
jgi:hypothetical protein